MNSSIHEFIKPLKSEAIHETGLSRNVVASFFPLIIFILLCFNVLSTVPRENRLADFLYIYEKKKYRLRKAQILYTLVVNISPVKASSVQSYAN